MKSSEILVRSKRLLLRQPHASDSETLYRLHSDPDTNRYNPNGPASREQVASYVLDWSQHWQQHGFGYCCVTTAEDSSTVMGVCGVARKQIGHYHGLNLYFRFSPEFWGMGYAREAASAALEYASSTLVDTVYAKVRADNLPSRKVLESLSMSIIDTVDDVPPRAPSLIYALRQNTEGK